ncbi:MAG: aminotransferase class I/II-fold pyridoxal phosphate-dependent enzyme [Planctomycetes bacterium]|nr:aminotransferase class I/II-fold pyridoxal phosphate-dependent enzyme [Planctomycetota bacterium]
MSERVPGLRADARIGLEIEVEGARYRACCGSDYLGLARDPRVIEAAQRALTRYGLSPSASRVTSGETREHRACEEALARFAGTADAVIVPIGFLAAQALVEALEGQHLWLLHRRAHAALEQAARQLVGAGRGSFGERWEHPDELRAVAAELVDSRGRGALADAFFPASGITLPLPEAHAALGACGAPQHPLVIDEAHSFGVLGPGGRGLAAAAGLGERDQVYAVGTLSKAVGAHGGFVSGSRELCAEIRARAALYVGATPMPAAVAVAARTAIEIALAEPERRERVLALAERMCAGLRALGLEAPQPSFPVFSLSRGLDPQDAQRALRNAGYLAPISRYPGVPPGGALAITLSAAHEERDVARLLEVLEGCRTLRS